MTILMDQYRLSSLTINLSDMALAIRGDIHGAS